MLWKCCTQCASKFGKCSSGHRTGKGQFSLQFQRRTMSKNFQNTVQLQSFHILARLCSKSFKLSFSNMWTKKFQMYKLGLEVRGTRDQIDNICWIINSTWTENFQMFKLDIEKAEESEIKLPSSVGSSRKQESSRKTCTSALLTTLKSLTVWITTNCGNFLKRWEYQSTLFASWETVCGSRRSS